MAAASIETGPFAFLNPAHLLPPLLFVVALLLGAVVVAFVRRWHQKGRSLGPSASEQLAEFRSLYEKGHLSEEEYRRLRTVLGGEIRQSNNLPPVPRTPASEGIKPGSESSPGPDGGTPSTGIRPE